MCCWSVMRAGMWMQIFMLVSSKHSDDGVVEAISLLLRITMSFSSAWLLYNLSVPLLLQHLAWSGSTAGKILDRERHGSV